MWPPTNVMWSYANYIHLEEELCSNKSGENDGSCMKFKGFMLLIAKVKLYRIDDFRVERVRKSLQLDLIHSFLFIS